MSFVFLTPNVVAIDTLADAKKAKDHARSRNTIVLKFIVSIDVVKEARAIVTAFFEDDQCLFDRIEGVPFEVYK